MRRWPTKKDNCLAEKSVYDLAFLQKLFNLFLISAQNVAADFWTREKKLVIFLLFYKLILKIDHGRKQYVVDISHAHPLLLLPPKTGTAVAISGEEEEESKKAHERKSEETQSECAIM